MSVQVEHGDCLEVMARLSRNGVQIDSVVTDPPYHLTSIVQRFGKDNAAPAKSNGATGVYGRAAAGFMGQTWDGGDVAFRPETWQLVAALLKPGGHMVVFGGTRTYHRLACAIEDAGFEIRDAIMWHYGSGFPKSHSVSKAIDKTAGRIGQSVLMLKHELRRCVEASGKSGKQIDKECGFRAMNYLTLPADGKRPDPWVNVLPSQEKWLVMRRVLGCGSELNAVFAEAEREVTGTSSNAIAGGTGHHAGVGGSYGYSAEFDITAPATDAAKQWDGWGTALKPATEIICLARKPLSEKTVAANVLRWGTGALNIDGCRVHADDAQGYEYTVKRLKPGATLNKTGGNWRPEEGPEYQGETKPGRWPANVIHDGSEEVMAAFARAGVSKSTGGRVGNKDGCYSNLGSTGWSGAHEAGDPGFGDTGTAARFFKSCEFSTEELLISRAKATLETWNSALANTADNSSSLSKEAVVSVLNDAAIWVSRAANLSSVSLEPSTPVTPIELRRLSETLIATILSIESGCSPAWLHERYFSNGSLVSVAETRELIGTTTITISQWKSDGSAAPATFSITLNNSAPGEAVSPSSRFHYCAKADKADRLQSKHPTVKPIDLIAYLCRLITPPGGTVLDPFAGSGTTAMACLREGFDAVLIEKEARFVADIRHRLAHVEGADTPLFQGVPT